MRTITLLLALTTLPACDDGKIDLGEWENGGPDADGANTDSGMSNGGPDVNDSGNATGDDGSASTDEGSADDTSEIDTGDPRPTAKDIDGDGVTVEDGDCDDSDPTIFPGAPEQCDDIDHDCDGLAYNNLLVRYDSIIGESWTEDFPTIHSVDADFTAAELWLGYRDFDTDMNAYDEDGRLEYTGTIRPLVATSLEERDRFRETIRIEYTHHDDGRIQSERFLQTTVESIVSDAASTSEEDDVATLTGAVTESAYLIEYSFNEAGQIKLITYDEGTEIDGTIERVFGYAYADSETGFVKYEEEDTNGDDLADNLTTYTYGPRGELLFVDVDTSNDGVKDRQQSYRYSLTTGLLLEFSDSFLPPTYTPSTMVTSYEYDDDGNLIFTSTGEEGEDVLNEWTRHTYEAGHLIKTEVGQQTATAVDGETSEIVLYEVQYTRDDDGRWTSRTTTSSTLDRQSGTESATYNIDGHWTGWNWIVEGSEEADASMTSTCLGPPSADIIADF